MKLRLLEHLRCTECRDRLKLVTYVPEGEPLDATEVMSGMLACVACGCHYAIEGGIPRLPKMGKAPPLTNGTASSFGFLWAQSDDNEHTFRMKPYHFSKMADTLGLPPPHGLILDAGCGEGIDLIQQATVEGNEVIGVELSEGGCATTFRRTLRLPSAHVVQADLSQLPFANDTFHFAYSYGVLHHLADPPAGIQELARVTRRGGRVAIYLYEDFAERGGGWRLVLRAVNQLRHLTVRMPHRLLHRLCQLGSPVVYLTLTVPYTILSRIPVCRELAASIPYRHGSGPFSLVGDLYDRFSAPVEVRYNRQAAVAFLEAAGLMIIAVANNRGWMIAGEKPS